VHDEHERQQRDAVEARLQTDRGPPLVALLRRWRRSAATGALGEPLLDLKRLVDVRRALAEQRRLEARDRRSRDEFLAYQRARLHPNL
jgi:hypothetical protein